MKITSNIDRAVTMSDVGQVAGVSPMTVSNVINGKRGIVKPDTWDRVEGAIESMGYRPNNAARTLRSAKSRTIGLIVISDYHSIFSDPFISELADGLNAGINEHDYSFLVQSISPEDLEWPLEARHLHCDLICLLLSGNAMLRVSILKLIARLQRPVVLLQQKLEQMDKNLCVVRQDDENGGKLLTTYLIGRGARRFLALLPALEWHAMVARLDGIRSALSRFPDFRLDVILSEGETPMAAKEALARYGITDDLPDAILAGNDQMAIATHEYLMQAGVSIPDQVLLTGFNAFSPWRYFKPQITTVRSPSRWLGKCAAEAMIHRIKMGSFREQEVVLPVTFVPGNTS